MAQSQLNIFNMALSVCGADYTLTSVDEESVPASLCLLWYDTVRKTVLRAAHWNSAKRYVRLTEEAERDPSADWIVSDPAPGFAYSYVIPAELLAARYLTDFSRFEIGYDDDKKILSCDVGGSQESSAPVLCYTADVTNVSLWEPDLYNSVVYALAGSISLGLHGKPQRADMNIGMANNILREARANTANEMHRHLVQFTERLQSRGFRHDIPSPYIYPYGNLFSSPGAPVT